MAIFLDANSASVSRCSQGNRRQMQSLSTCTNALSASAARSGSTRATSVSAMSATSLARIMSTSVPAALLRSFIPSRGRTVKKLDARLVFDYLNAKFSAPVSGPELQTSPQTQSKATTKPGSDLSTKLIAEEKRSQADAEVVPYPI